MKPNRLLAWWQLLRVANVFTAISNVVAGFLLVRGEWQPLATLFFLMASSSLLYVAGMVLNDAFDAELDARERPQRPIPSGRITRAAAFRAGFGLLALGTGCAFFVSWRMANAAPAAAGTLLALAIVGYDARWKQTEFGPSAMGICRYLNVLLGASAASDLAAEPAAWIYAAVVGMYTIGLTLFARSENEPNKTRGQSLGGLVTLAALALLAALPITLSSFQETQIPMVWLGCLLLMCLVVVGSHRETQRRPGPTSFRRHVSMLLLGFILLDTLACTAAAGWPSGLIVLTLIVPTLIAKRWAPMT